MYTGEEHSKKPKHQPRRDKVPMTEPLCSPFVQRITKITGDLSAHGRMVAEWVFHPSQDPYSKSAHNSGTYHTLKKLK